MLSPFSGEQVVAASLLLWKESKDFETRRLCSLSLSLLTLFLTFTLIVLDNISANLVQHTIRDTPRDQIILFFFYIVQTTIDPPPSF